MYFSIFSHCKCSKPDVTIWGHLEITWYLPFFPNMCIFLQYRFTSDIQCCRGWDPDFLLQGPHKILHLQIHHCLINSCKFKRCVYQKMLQLWNWHHKYLQLWFNLTHSCMTGFVPRFPLHYNSLVCSKNNYYFVGIDILRKKGLVNFFV